MMQAVSVMFNSGVCWNTDCSIKCLCLKAMHNYSVAKGKIKIGSVINIFLQIHEQKNRQALALRSEKQTKQCKFWLDL